MKGTAVEVYEGHRTLGYGFSSMPIIYSFYFALAKFHEVKNFNQIREPVI